MGFVNYIFIFHRTKRTKLKTRLVFISKGSLSKRVLRLTSPSCSKGNFKVSFKSPFFNLLKSSNNCLLSRSTTWESFAVSCHPRICWMQWKHQFTFKVSKIHTMTAISSKQTIYFIRIPWRTLEYFQILNHLSTASLLGKNWTRSLLGFQFWSC